MRASVTATGLVEGLRELGGVPDRLLAIAQPEPVKRALERTVPELAAGTLALDVVRARRIRIKQGACTVAYELVVGRAGGRQDVVRLNGVADPSPTPGGAWVAPGVAFGEEGWRCALPELGLTLEAAPTDAALAALPVLTDPRRAKAFLEEAIGSASPAYRGIRILGCEPRVVRYKPGSRCTITYRVRYGPETGATPGPRLIAKVYRGDKGRSADRAMRALWSSDLRRSPSVSIAEPLAFVPRWNVLIQGPVPGSSTLKDLLRRGVQAGSGDEALTLSDLVAGTAAALRALHRSGVEARPATWEQEMAEVREVIARLAPWLPGIRPAAAPLLSRLEAFAARHPPEPPAPAHGSFRPAQVLVDEGGRIGLIDFDGFCRAEPAMDLALFRATVVDVGVRALPGTGRSGPGRFERLDRVDELADRFLHEYEARSPVSRERVALWEALDLLTNVLHCWTKVRPNRLDDALLLLQRHLDRSPLGPAAPSV